MRLGLDSYSFHIALAAGTYDLFRALDWMAGLGFSGFQININGPQGRFLGADPSDTAHLSRVRARLASLGFFAEIGGGHAANAALVTRQLQLAADLGADTLRTVVGFDRTINRTIEQARSALETVIPLAHRLGVRLAIENHEDVTAAELRQLLDAIDDPFVGACFDTGNDLVVYGDPLAAARVLAPRALTTHIKDHKLVRIAGTVQSIGVPLGTGDIDLPAIIGVIGRESPLDRLLIQDTTGYSAPLNPFRRADLVPLNDHLELKSYATASDLRADGLLLNLNGLSTEELQALADRQEHNLEHDLAYIRSILAC